MSAQPTVANLGHGVSMVRVPLPFERLSWVNAYVLAGPDGCFVIDCGVDTEEGFTALVDGLAMLGHDIASVHALIGTHLHVDHMGMAGRVIEATDCRFIMHRAAPDGFEAYNDWATGNVTMGALAARHGANPDQATEIATTNPRPAWAPPAAVPTDLVIDGDEIKIGGDRFLTVLHTPGHDAAHICLLDSRSGALFSGDHVLPRITPVVLFDPAGSDRLATYLGSLERIEKADIDLTFPAHGTQIDRGSLRARQILLHHERRLGAIMQEVRHHGPRNAWEIMESLFRPHLNVFERRLAFSETLAHLEHLRLREDLEFTEDEGAVRYRMPGRALQ